jgi:hypothetical protein
MQQPAATHYIQPKWLIYWAVLTYWRSNGVTTCPGVILLASCFGIISKLPRTVFPCWPAPVLTSLTLILYPRNKSICISLLTWALFPMLHLDQAYTIERTLLHILHAGQPKLISYCTSKGYHVYFLEQGVCCLGLATTGRFSQVLASVNTLSHASAKTNLFKLFPSMMRPVYGEANH